MSLELSMLFLEGLSLLFGVGFILLVINEYPVAWVSGVLNSGCLLAISLLNGFIFHSVLMGYYIFIGLYGFFSWRQKEAHGAYSVVVKRLTLKQHAVILTLGLILSLLFWLFIRDLGTSPWLDSAIFSFSVLATYLQVKKYIDNWAYWAILNVLALLMMALSELYLVALLMLFYLIMSFVGMYSWHSARQSY